MLEPLCKFFPPSLILDRRTTPLLVRLAGVALTPEGKQWLQKNLLPAKMVWIKLISREDDTLYCLVSQKRVRFYN